MFNDTAEVIKTSAVFLAIVLPILATAIAYWAASRSKPIPPKPTIGGEGFAAIGGALVTQDMLDKAMKTAHECKDSINRLTRGIEVFNERDNESLKVIAEEIMKLRRAAEEAAASAKNSSRRR